MKIYNFGSMNIDNVFKVDQFIRPGESKITHELNVFCGGKGLNQSIACAKAGIETYHIGMIGPDGGMLRDKLEECGVKTDYIRTVDARTGCTAIQIDDNGQNCILVYSGTNNLYTDEFVDEVLATAGPDDVILLQNEINKSGYVIQRAKELGIPVAINAAPYTDDLMEMPIGDVTWLIVNEIEGASLIGMADIAGAGAENVDFDEVADKLVAKYPGVELVLTLGSAGCIYVGKDGRMAVPARKVKAVDTTAAGDTFIGFFLSAVMQGYSAEQALNAATCASSIAVQRAGASDSIPENTVAELLEM